MISFIIHPFLQRNIDRKVLAYSLSDLVKRSSPWEEVLIELMERHSHHSVCIVKSFLNSVAMVNIDVKIEHSRVDLQQLEDA